MNSPSVAQKRLAWLLWGVPLWLAVSAGLGLWYYYHREKMRSQEEQERFAQSVSVESIADDLHKIVEVIGERNTTSEKASANLTRTASMVEGLLGPSNIGYVVNRIPGPARWPVLQVSVRGKDDSAPTVWVITSYDSKPGSSAGNANGLAGSLAAAQAMAGDKPKARVDFIFIPHAEDTRAPLDSELTKLSTLRDKPGPAWFVSSSEDPEMLGRFAKSGLPVKSFVFPTLPPKSGDFVSDAQKVANGAENLVEKIRAAAGESPR